jgi:hypothetical protein
MTTPDLPRDPTVSRAPAAQMCPGHFVGLKSGPPSRTHLLAPICITGWMVGRCLTKLVNPDSAVVTSAGPATNNSSLMSVFPPLRDVNVAGDVDGRGLFPTIVWTASSVWA